MQKASYSGEHEAFRNLCREFLTSEAVPYHDEWERNGCLSRDVWKKAGKAGFLGTGVAVEHGGAGDPDIRYHTVFAEELVRAGVTAPGFVAHNDLIASYLSRQTTPEQRRRWLPALCSGELIGAIAMSEPEAGSNVADMRTTAVLEDDHYVLNGSKKFITNGESADVILVVAKTRQQRGGQGISTLIVERDTPGFTRGPKADKVGWRASDNCDLFFDDCRVPASNLIGKENAGMAYLMSGLPRERLSIAIVALAAIERMLDETLEFARHRRAFDQPIGSFQHNKFALATMETQATIARVFLEHCMAEFNANRLTATDSAKAKWWTTELQVEVANQCLQLHGGRGYLWETPIAKEWANSRVQTIYGGTTEIMKEIIGSSLGL